jgi:ribonuclease Z
MKLRRFALLTVAAVVAVGAAAYVFRAPLSMAVAQRVAASRLAADTLNELPDGLHVGLCGAGSPMPDDRRMGACTVVVAGQRLFVFDTGNGSARNIGKLGFVHGRIEAIFLSHFHSDHLDGLGELLMQRWVSTGNVAPVPVYGPSGVEQVVAGFMQAYEQDQHYRVAHHGEPTVPSSGFGAIAKSFPVPPVTLPVVLIKEADLEVSAFRVDHKPVHPAVGYRITYKGRSVVLSGDTTKSAAVQREATGVDLLVHEALSPKMVDLLGQGAAAAGRLNVKKLMADIIDYHTPPEQAAEIARDAKVRYLLLSHIAPPLPLPGMEKAFLGGAPGIFEGPIRVGADGDFISLPAGSTRIDVSRRF